MALTYFRVDFEDNHSQVSVIIDDGATCVPQKRTLLLLATNVQQLRHLIKKAFPGAEKIKVQAFGISIEP